MVSAEGLTAIVLSIQLGTLKTRWLLSHDIASTDIARDSEG